MSIVSSLSSIGNDTFGTESVSGMSRTETETETETQRERGREKEKETGGGTGKPNSDNFLRLKRKKIGILKSQEMGLRRRLVRGRMTYFLIYLISLFLSCIFLS